MYDSKINATEEERGDGCATHAQNQAKFSKMYSEKYVQTTN